MATLAHALDIGNSIQAPEVAAVDPRRAREAKKTLGELYQHESTRHIIDDISQTPESALLLAGLTADMKKCRHYATAAMKKESENETGPQRIVRMGDQRTMMRKVKEDLLGPNGHAAGSDSLHV